MTVVRCLLLAAVVAAGGPLLRAAEPKEKTPTLPAEVSYYKDVRPLFQQHCQGCHQPAKAHGDYVMTDFAELFKKSDKGEIGVVPGQPDKSMLYRQIVPQGGKPPAMPRDKEPLSDHNVALIKRWIEQGAL